MTREETIALIEGKIKYTDEICHIYGEFINIDDYEKLKEALNMAIEALLQPVIGHCANCKWCEEIVENKYVCNYQNSLVLGSYVEPDFFCKYWEEGVKQ